MGLYVIGYAAISAIAMAAAFVLMIIMAARFPQELSMFRAQDKWMLLVSYPLAAVILLVFQYAMLRNIFVGLFLLKISRGLIDVADLVTFFREEKVIARYPIVCVKTSGGMIVLESPERSLFRPRKFQILKWMFERNDYENLIRLLEQKQGHS
jgi:hypothetical protein